MACRFCEDDIKHFEPKERYLTGEALIKRWTGQPAIQPEAFVRAKIAEGRLTDIHPTCGRTQGAFPNDTSYPSLAGGLFALSQIEQIEETLTYDPQRQKVPSCTAALAWCSDNKISLRKAMVQLQR